MIHDACFAKSTENIKAWEKPKVTASKKQCKKIGKNVARKKKKKIRTKTMAFPRLLGKANYNTVIIYYNNNKYNKKAQTKQTITIK